MSDPTVSVVIPTLGRARLAEAVASVRAQGVPVDIVIVNDSGEPLVLPSGTEGDDLRVVDTPGRTGAAHARNIGLAEVNGDLVAFLDDDDMWLRGHLADAVGTLAEHPEIDIYSCRSLVVDSLTGHGRIEPADLLDEGSLQRHFYGVSAIWSRSRRVPTPTLVFRARLARHRLDETLRQREDTWWLLTAESEHGARVLQSPHIGVVVYVEAERIADYRATGRHFEWAQRIDELHPGAGAAHVLARGRDAARAGDVSAVAALARELRSLRGGGRRLPVLAAQGVAALGIGVCKRRRRDV